MNKVSRRDVQSILTSVKTNLLVGVDNENIRGIDCAGKGVDIDVSQTKLWYLVKLVDVKHGGAERGKPQVLLNGFDGALHAGRCGRAG